MCHLVCYTCHSVGIGGFASPFVTSMRRHRFKSAPQRGNGEVLYVSAPGMGVAKTRPCLVLGA
jgi:hypothetical protein